MSPKKAILLTILGILAAWLIIRGIIYWESSHPTDAGGSALVFQEETVPDPYPAAGTAAAEWF